VSPRPGPRRLPIGYRAPLEHVRGIDEIIAEEAADGTTLTDVLSRAVDAELKRAARRRARS
jgi:hypothetical protein